MTNINYKNIASKIKFEGRAFINGSYVDAIDGGKFETINPATGETLCSVAKCNSVVCGQEHHLNLEKIFCLNLQNY